MLGWVNVVSTLRWLHDFRACSRQNWSLFFWHGFEIIRSHQIVLCDKVIVCVFGSYDMFECVYVSYNRIVIFRSRILAPYPHCNPTGVCWRLMPGPCQERHLSVHHLRVGKPWANGRANSSAHGWNADAKFDQRGKGNWKSCGPSRPGQCNRHNPEWKAFRTTCCFRNSSDFFHLNKFLQVVTSWARTRPWLVRADPQLAANEFWHLMACWKYVQRLGAANSSTGCCSTLT